MTQAEGSSDALMKYGAPTQTEVEGDVAYVVIPAVYTFKLRGQAMTEKGLMTFVLHRESGAWKIASWTWTGEPARAVKLGGRGSAAFLSFFGRCGRGVPPVSI